MSLPSSAQLLEVIDRAFGHAPRPKDSELLHPRSMDDHDIDQLYGIPHWRDVPDAVLEHEYAGLFFLGPAGFRHFLPAYMSYALRHPRTDQMVGESTIYALRPETDDLREFTLSKFSLFDASSVPRCSPSSTPWRSSTISAIRPWRKPSRTGIRSLERSR